MTFQNLLLFVDQYFISVYFSSKQDEGISGRQERKKSWITIDKEFVVRDQSLKRFRRVRLNAT